jgi:excisionase family DNA binding protein
MTAVPVVPVNETVPAPLLLSAVEAAALLGIGKTKLYELIARGDLRPVHIGRCCRIPVDEVREYVQRLRVAA